MSGDVREAAGLTEKQRIDQPQRLSFVFLSTFHHQLLRLKSVDQAQKNVSSVTSQFTLAFPWVSGSFDIRLGPVSVAFECPLAAKKWSHGTST